LGRDQGEFPMKEAKLGLLLQNTALELPLEGENSIFSGMRLSA
jgi:hypothetical protein